MIIVASLFTKVDFKSGPLSTLAQSGAESNNRTMTEKEIVLETIRALPDDCSLEEIAERVEFMAAVQKGLDQLDRGEGIPHDEVKNSSPHGLQTNLVSRCTRRPIPSEMLDQSLVRRDLALPQKSAGRTWRRSVP